MRYLITENYYNGLILFVKDELMEIPDELAAQVNAEKPGLLEPLRLSVAWKADRIIRQAEAR